MIKEYDSIYSNSPSISSGTIKSFTKQFKRDPDIESTGTPTLEIERESEITGDIEENPKSPAGVVTRKDERFRYELDRFMQEGYQLR